MLGYDVNRETNVMGLIRSLIRRAKRQRVRTDQSRSDSERIFVPTQAVESPAAVEEVLEGLILFKFDACPYCRVVQRSLKQLGLDIEQRDTRDEPRFREQLLRRTGRTQVPCLFIDNQPMFESLDIVAWLEENSQRYLGGE